MNIRGVRFLEIKGIMEIFLHTSPRPHQSNYSSPQLSFQLTIFLLDKQLHLKLSDFQGNQISQDGHVLLDSGSGERYRFYYPRADPSKADIKTDLFALGCTIYFIMMRHAVFPDIIDREDGWLEKVQDRFAKHQFPQEIHACSSITQKCWHKEYTSAQELLQDLEDMEEGYT